MTSSSIISSALNASGSILTATISHLPLIVIVTAPPPAVPVKWFASISSCIFNNFCCIFWISRIFIGRFFSLLWINVLYLCLKHLHNFLDHRITYGFFSHALLWGYTLLHSHCS